MKNQIQEKNKEIKRLKNELLRFRGAMRPNLIVRK